MDEKTKLIMSKLPLTWGGPKPINTKRGRRVLRIAEIPQDSKFWDLWRKHKDAIKSIAVTIGKNDKGDWQACHWGMPEDDAPPQQITPDPEPPVTDAKEQIAAAGIALPGDRIKNASKVPVMPPPHGLAYLPFQEEGIRFHRGRGRTLIADEMGLGKTVQALGIINDSRRDSSPVTYNRVLVLCPASLKGNWATEAEKWLNGHTMTHRVEGRMHDCSHVTDPLAPDETQVTICNYEVLYAYTPEFRHRFDLIVLDEAQYIKTLGTQRTKAALDLCLARHEQHVLFLTGTPIMNRPEEIFPIYHCCSNASSRKDWRKFTEIYCNAYTDRFGRHTHGASNLGDLYRELKEFTIRRLKKDVLPQLPAKRRQFIELEAGDASVQQWIDSTTQTGIELEAEIKKLQVTNKASKKLDDKLKEMSRLRKQQGIAKVPVCAAYIKDVMASLGTDGKLIVFAHHTEVICQLVDLLQKFKPLCIMGSTGSAERDVVVKRFQDPSSGHRIFIGNIKAAGTGLTLHAASTVIFAESDWSPQQNLQCEDRAHRIGQAESVLAQYINVTGSIDMKIAKSCMRKMEIANTAIDGEGVKA